MMFEHVWQVLLVLGAALGGWAAARWAAHERPGTIQHDYLSLSANKPAARPAEGAGEPSTGGPRARRRPLGPARTQRDIVVYGLELAAPTQWAAEAALLPLVEFLVGGAVLAPRPTAVRVWRQRSGRWAARFWVADYLAWAVWASKWRLAGSAVSIHEWQPVEMLAQRREAKWRRWEQEEQGRQRRQAAEEQGRQRQQAAEEQGRKRQQAAEESAGEAARAFLAQLAAEQQQRLREQLHQRREQEQPEQPEQEREQEQEGWQGQPGEQAEEQEQQASLQPLQQQQAGSPARTTSSWSVDPSLTCEVCDQPEPEDTMLLCEGCHTGWHTACLQPPLQEVPAGAWYCPACTGTQPQTAQQAAEEGRRQRRAEARAKQLARLPTGSEARRGTGRAGPEEKAARRSARLAEAAQLSRR